jgi:hypothetical protein
MKAIKGLWGLTKVWSMWLGHIHFLSNGGINSHKRAHPRTFEVYWWPLHCLSSELEELKGALALAGEGLEDMEDVKDDNKVPLNFGGGGLPVADGTLGGSMDDRRDGGAGGFLGDDIVGTGELTEEVLISHASC